MRLLFIGLILMVSLDLFGDNYGACSIDDSNESYSISRRGCCSHHGGVCGCVSGRAKCCDGTLSPSCGCD